MERLTFANPEHPAVKAGVMKQLKKSTETPDVSTLGANLRAAIEIEINKKLSCGDCIGYLRSLNHQTEHNSGDITQYLYANFPWPAEWRKRYPGGSAKGDLRPGEWRERRDEKTPMRQRITEIVTAAIEAVEVLCQ